MTRVVDPFCCSLSLSSFAALTASAAFLRSMPCWMLMTQCWQSLVHLMASVLTRSSVLNVKLPWRFARPFRMAAKKGADCSGKTEMTSLAREFDATLTACRVGSDRKIEHDQRAVLSKGAEEESSRQSQKRGGRLTLDLVASTNAIRTPMGKTVIEAMLKMLR